MVLRLESQLRRLIWMALLVFVPFAAAADPVEEVLPSCSSDASLWWVSTGGGADGSFLLRFHTIGMEGLCFQTLNQLPRQPEAMAAWDGRLWMVFPVDPRRSRSPAAQREVYAIDVRRNPVQKSYYTVPPDHLEMVAPLPGDGRLAGFVTTKLGPVALIVPPQRAGAGVVASEDAAASEPVMEEPRLLQLIGGRWNDVALPEELEPCGACRLGAGGAEGELLYIIADGAPPPGVNGKSTLFMGDAGGMWKSAQAPVRAAEVRSLTRVGSQIAAVIGKHRDSQCSVAYLRPNQLLELGRFDRPAGAWSVNGMRDGLYILAGSGDGFGSAGDAAAGDEAGSPPLAIRIIEPLTGRVGGERVLTQLPMDFFGVLRMPLLLAVVTLALVLIAVLKPANRAPVSLPAGYVPLPPSLRIVAFLIDLAPPGVAVMLLLHRTFGELFGLPLLTLTFEDSIPYAIMVLAAVGHSVICEVVFRRTLGKWIVGASLMDVDGSAPRPGRVIVRNLVKLAIALVPPLAVISLANPNYQGLHDLVGRTVVVRPIEDPSKNADQDR